MRVAAEIPRGLLPNKAPVVTGYGIVGSNTPARSVRGDYYDFAAQDGRLLLALGDVSREGTGAALLMTGSPARSLPPTWGQDAAGLHDAILRAVDALAAGRKPADDRTLIVLKRG